MKKNWFDEGYGFFGQFYQFGDHSQEGFDANRKMTRKKRTKREVNYIIKYLNPSFKNTILDCPCGSGRHVFELSKLGYKVIGVDLNESMLGFAKEEKTSGIKNAPEFFKMDMRSLGLESNSVDYIINMFISFGFFDSDEENEKVVKEFYRVLKPGGKLMIHLDLNYDNVISGEFNGREHITRNCTYKGQRKTLEIREKYNPRKKRLEGRWTMYNGEQPESKEYSIRIYGNREEFIPMIERNGFKNVTVIDPESDAPLKPDSIETILIAEK